MARRKADSRVPTHYLTGKPDAPKPSGRISGGTEPGFTLNKLRHDDFHEICGLTLDVKIMRPDVDGPLSGRVVVTPDGMRGTVSGYAVDADTDKRSKFARVNGRLYNESALKLQNVTADFTATHGFFELVKP